MKRANIFAVVLVIAAFVITAGYAIQGQVRAVRAEEALERVYAHAFLELTTAAGELDAALQKSLYATEGPLRQALCQQVYAKALAAQAALGELPYANLRLEHTAAFFAKTGDYAAALSRGQGENASETLAQLSQIAHSLSTALQDLQLELEAGTLRLDALDAAADALASQVESGGRELGGLTFQDVEADFPEMPALVYDGPFSEHLSAAQPKALAGLPLLNEAEARQKAADFLFVKENTLTLLSTGDGLLPTYVFSLPQDGGVGYIEVTRQGGRVLEYFQDRRPGDAVLTPRQGVELAQNYLTAWGFGRMEASYYLQREGALTVHLAPVQGEVYCYPDLVKVTIALDTGRLLGYEAHGYLSQHRDRDLPAPSVTPADARSALPDGLTVLAVRQALIPTAGGSDEVLTYEFKCETAQGSHVLIYVNAQTGLQQNILLLLEDASGTLAL